MNTPSESYEWFDMSISREDEFRLLRDRINIIEHAPQGQAAGTRAAAEGYRPGKQSRPDFPKALIVLRSIHRMN